MTEVGMTEVGMYIGVISLALVVLQIYSNPQNFQSDTILYGFVNPKTVYRLKIRCGCCLMHFVVHLSILVTTY